MMPTQAGRKVAPPTACMSRKRISTETLGARPQSSELTVKISTAARKTRLRPSLSLSAPATGSVRSWPSAYAVMVQPHPQDARVEVSADCLERDGDDGEVDRAHQHRGREEDEDELP